VLFISFETIAGAVETAVERLHFFLLETLVGADASAEGPQHFFLFKTLEGRVATALESIDLFLFEPFSERNFWFPSLHLFLETLSNVDSILLELAHFLLFGVGVDAGNDFFLFKPLIGGDEGVAGVILFLFVDGTAFFAEHLLLLEPLLEVDGTDSLTEYFLFMETPESADTIGSAIEDILFLDTILGGGEFLTFNSSEIQV